MKFLLASLVGLTLTLPPQVGRTCGMFVPAQVESNTAIDAQRALMIVRADSVELHLQPRATTDGTDFAWIIPVPPGPTVALGDAAIFSALDELTTPHVTVAASDSGGGGIGCGSADKAGAGNFGSNGVQHFGGGTLGDYAYDIIGGQTVEAIEAWLDDNGYATPDGFAAAITPYVKQAFVAVKLVPGVSSDTDLQPLVVRFPRPLDGSLGYALGLSRLSTTDVAPVLLWVLADKRYRVANYASANLSTIVDVMKEQRARGEEADYQQAITQITTESAGRIAFTEFARDLDAATAPSALAPLVDGEVHYLTRLYMEVPKAQIEDLVVTFAANAPDVDPNATASTDAPAPVTAGCIGLALLLLAARRRG